MRAIACLSLAAVLSAQTNTDVFSNAVTALRDADYPAAEAGFQAVLKSSPQHVGALQNLGLVYSRTGRLDLAIATYRRALALSPDNRGLLLNLGLVLMKRDSYAEALPVFRLIRSYSDTAVLYQLTAGYLKQNPGDDAWRTATAFLDTAPPAPGNLVLCQALTDAGRFDDALDRCRRVLAIDPQFPGVHRELGKALVGQHSPDAAAELTTAVSDNPTDPQAAYYLGVALLQDDRAEEAARRLERARQLDPSFWGTWFYLGKAKLKLHETTGAIPLFQKAAELNPGASIVFYELGLALKSAGRADEAARAMDRVRELRAQELANDINLLHSR